MPGLRSIKPANRPRGRELRLCRRLPSNREAVASVIEFGADDEHRFRPHGAGRADLRITGRLTIRGVSKEIIFHAEVQGTDIDPWGNTRIGLEVTGQLSRADDGMTFDQALGSGNMLVGDKLNLALDISAVKAA